MYQPLNCIALRMVRHSDRHNILTAYARQTGRIAFLLPAANTPRALSMRALAAPMSRFDCMAQIRPGRDLFNISEMRRRGALPSASPVKSAIAMFAADVANALLREPQTDTNLFDFLDGWSAQLVPSSPDATANMHIAFLMGMMHFMGIEPDWSTYTPGAVFDLSDGIFRPSAPLHRMYLTSGESTAAFALRSLRSRTAHLFRLSRTDRNRILDLILRYYQVHFPSMGSLNSLGVLRTLFDF